MREATSLMWGKDAKGTPGWGGQVLLCWVILGYLYPSQPCPPPLSQARMQG